MSELDLATQTAARLSEAASQAGLSPLEFLRDGMSGVSTDGSVRVWVDGLGRIQRVRIAPGSVGAGDEERLAAALTEAAKAAAGAIADLLTPDELREQRRELEEPMSISTSEPPSRRPVRPAPPDDDDMFPVIRA